ncbi:oxidoreductase [Stappia sp.]|uniref:oxidoreductase n=1 Tax=Stappia sp. TaxID=1870903 RepID=UPI003A9A1E3F
MLIRCIILSVLAGIGLVLAGPARSGGPVVLTVEGRIEGEASRDFTISDLEKLGVTSVTTSTPWHDKIVTFEGVRLADLMAYVGATGDQVEGVALNNFYAEIPRSDFTTYDALLAFKADGAYLGVRDKGPLFVIYPFDRFPELKNELYYSRSIWQLRRINVK